MKPSRMTPEQAKRLTLAEQHEWYRRLTSRRTLLRGGVAGAGALVAGPALLGGTATAASAETAARSAPASPMLLAKSGRPAGSSVPPVGRHIAYGRDPASQISVAWQVPAQVSNPFIRVGTTPWELSDRIGAELRALTTQVSDTKPVDSVPPSAPATIEQFYLHARITGLRPGHTYFYSVGHDGWDPAAGFPAIGSFSTEMEAWYSPDGYGGQYARFDFPGEASSAAPPAYYSFAYGNVGVVSLDANDVSFEIPANNGYTGGAQVTWLGATLASLRKQPGIDFIVAYFHHCAYCTCAVHGSEGGARQLFVPLFDKYSVDLVINGHNHIYERTDPLRGGVSTPAPIGATVRPATEGTTYIAAGGARVSLYDFTAPDSYEGHLRNVPSVTSFVNEAGGTTVNETVTWSRTRFTGYSLLVMDSKPGWRPGAPSTLTVRGLSEDGSELDRVILAR